MSQLLGFGGLELAVTRWGDPAAPPVVLLGGNRRAWDGVGAALAAEGSHAIAIELRGHGELANVRADLDALAGDARAVLASLARRPVVVAAGVGALVALIALGEAGAPLAAGLVLVDPEASARGTAFDGEAATARALAVGDRFKLPTLVLGATGAATCALGEQLAHAIRGAELGELPGSGPILDEPAAMQRIAAFIARVAPRAPRQFIEGADPRTLRDAFGCFATGITVITARDGSGNPVGITANSFASVSLDPPLISFCVARTSSTLPALLAAPGFAVNVLHVGQQLASTQFATRGGDRFAGLSWDAWDTGAPILRDSLASFECVLFAQHDVGDHVLVIGRVRRAAFEPAHDPLLYFRGGYRRVHLG